MNKKPDGLGRMIYANGDIFDVIWKYRDNLLTGLGMEMQLLKFQTEIY